MKTVKRRRKENKTDYVKRLGLLKSGVPRLVFRRTNKYTIAEYITSHEAQDKVALGMTSKILLDYGWPKTMEGSLKSTPATYLLGFLFGKKIAEHKLKAPIMDLGMARNIHKSKTFAFIKGLNDSGISVKCDEEHYPEDSRIKGKHLKHDFSKTFDEVKAKINGGKK